VKVIHSRIRIVGITGVSIIGVRSGILARTEYSADEECDWQVDEMGYGLVHLKFDTAWNPPIGWYEALNALEMTVEAYYFEPGMSFCGQWSNPVEGIVDEYIDIDKPENIPYTIGIGI
jgi:hypothetical protein